MFIFIVLLFYIQEVQAREALWDQVRFNNLPRGRVYNIESGTGFFISPHHIVTNWHVVDDNCRNIAIRGAVQPNLVTIVSYDPNLDLAVLYSKSPATRWVSIRTNYQDIKVGDTVFVAGYPNEHGDSGNHITRQSRVIELSYEQLTNFSFIEFDNTGNVIDTGNSGGPLLDSNNNLIGVVKSKKEYFNQHYPTVKYKSVAVAISVQDLTKFLSNSGIIYNTSFSYSGITNYQTELMLQDYLVNIHCIKNN